MERGRDLSALLRARAERHPDRPFLTDLATSTDWTYGELDARVDALARGLADLGVAGGQYVNVMLPNRVEHVLVAAATHRLGAIYVAVNADFRGPALARMLNASGANVLVTTTELARELEAVRDELSEVEHVLPADDLESIERSDGPLPDGPSSDLDLATVIFTSGTTGPSKGVLLPHRALVRAAETIVEATELGPEDCVFTPYPLFHMRAAYLDVLPALLVGGRVVVAPRFSASAFWSQLRDHGVTVFSLLGTVMQILWRREPEPAEREHRVRLTWGGPISVDRAQFERRFGIPVLPGKGVYGMSEVGMVNMSSFDSGRSGVVRPTHDVRIAGDSDEPLPVGEIGEILVRPREPGVIFAGYLGQPEATVEACRNLWFHTGDLGHVDDHGRLVFVGRKRDMIRRGGHNISTWEIEEVVGTHPDVRASAAIGAPSALGEEEVVLFVVAAEDADLSTDDLLDFCRERMASFMVPQRVVQLDEIPTLANGKPARAQLVELAASVRRA